jgi:hypothetical protein
VLVAAVLIFHLDVQGSVDKSPDTVVEPDARSRGRGRTGGNCLDEPEGLCTYVH